MELLNLHAIRSRKARLGKAIGKPGYYGLLVISGTCLIAGATLVIRSYAYGYSVLGFGLLALMAAAWWQYDLSNVPAHSGSLTNRLSNDCLVALKPGVQYTPQRLWQILQTDWQASFILAHLVLSANQIYDLLSNDSALLDEVLQEALRTADSYQSTTVEIGHIITALLHTSPTVDQLLTRLKLTQMDINDVSGWLQRTLDMMRHKRTNFGGIGRDWASGFTPQLNRFGYNVSANIERQGMHFGSLVDSPGVREMKTAFSQGAGAVALVGPDGIGKTSHAYALAQNVLAETHDRALEHRQVIALDASAIVSAAQRPGDLEYILTGLLNEALHAGNVMLFLDDAQLFFQAGPGSFNATQILLPAVQSRALPLIFAMTPHDYQQLRGSNMNFAGQLTPVVLKELPEAEILKILTDVANNIEVRNKVVISYEAIKAAYRLSGRYEVDMAYPGKAVRLLEQSLAHTDRHILVTAASVEAAIEQTRGVKVGTAAPAEAEQLLHLEDQIHERMINQKRAVSVVANALRRARAGVSSPKRPIGSFLFLGPTGVGKTELAKAIAATYFSNETTMIRLDMSEYQQQSDVARILSDGTSEANSLLMRVREQPFSVVLLDEIEKAHPNILNLLLQLLDEGQLTDSNGRVVSFKDSVVIATSNAGADSIRKHIDAGEQLEQFEQVLTDELINSGQFKPELLNRFDEIVLFRPLTPGELAQVVRLMLNDINHTLAAQNISTELTDAAIAKIVAAGNDPRLGARPMRRMLQKAVENTVAEKILRGGARPGDHLKLDVNDLAI